MQPRQHMYVHVYICIYIYIEIEMCIYIYVYMYLYVRIEQVRPKHLARNHFEVYLRHMILQPFWEHATTMLVNSQGPAVFDACREDESPKFWCLRIVRVILAAQVLLAGLHFGCSRFLLSTPKHGQYAAWYLGYMRHHVN